VRIVEPARRHGIPDNDIWHAVRNPIRHIDEDDMTMIIGAATDGAVLEVGVIDFDDDDSAIVHAMTLRPKYYQFLS